MRIIRLNKPVDISFNGTHYIVEWNNIICTATRVGSRLILSSTFIINHLTVSEIWFDKSEYDEFLKIEASVKQELIKQ